MTVSEYIFDFLEKKGVKNVFMVSGSSAMWLTDALKRNDRLNAYCCHHEQAAAMSADCCGRVGDVPGVCLVTIGPGATNAITGVAEAYLDSSPMFVISGQANSKILQYQMDTGIRQKGTQSLDLEPMVSSITKYFAAVMSPDSIRFHMEKAYYSAMEGRRGPVWLDVPIDVQNRQAPEQMKGFDIPEDKKTDAEISSEALERLAKSEKPLVLAGFGVRASGSAGKLLEFCDKQNIPVVTSRGGIDVITTDNPLFVGRPGSYGDRASHFAIQECDFMLILGSRLSVSTIGYYPDRFGKNAYKVMADKKLTRETFRLMKIIIVICLILLIICRTERIPPIMLTQEKGGLITVRSCAESILSYFRNIVIRILLTAIILRRNYRSILPRALM